MRSRHGGRLRPDRAHDRHGRRRRHRAHVPMRALWRRRRAGRAGRAPARRDRARAHARGARALPRRVSARPRQESRAQELRGAQLGPRRADREGAAQITREPDMEHLARSLREPRPRWALPAGGGLRPASFPLLQTTWECQRRIGPAGVGPTSPSRCSTSRRRGSAGVGRVRVDERLRARSAEDRATPGSWSRSAWKKYTAWSPGSTRSRPHVVAGALGGGGASPALSIRGCHEPAEDPARAGAFRRASRG